MDKIKELQYQNLRKCLEENLIEPILGKNYYNNAMDVYSCDKQITEDIKSKYDIAKSNLGVFYGLSLISLITNVFLVLIIMMLIK